MSTGCRLVITIALSLAGCTGGVAPFGPPSGGRSPSGFDPCTDPQTCCPPEDLVCTGNNQAPEAVAGEDQAVDTGDVVTLEQTTDEPLFLSIDSRRIAECNLGRQGPYLATQLEKWIP